MSEVRELLDEMTRNDRGWATERTAQAILDVLEGRKKADKKIEKEKEKAVKEETKRSKAMAESADDLKRSLNVFGGSGMTLSRAMDSIQDKFEALNSPIGWLAISATVLADYLTDSITVLNDMYQVGITFTDGMNEMRMAAATSALTLDEFSKVIIENSAVIAKMGRHGARDFGLMSLAVRDSLRPFGQLAMTSEEVNSFLGEYLEIQRQQDLLDSMTRVQQANAATAYMRSLNDWTQALGKSKKELAESTKKVFDDIGVRARLRSMPEELRGIVTENIAKASAAFAVGGENVQNLMTELISTGGRPVSEASQMFLALSGDLGVGFRSLASELSRGEMSQDELNRRMNELIRNSGQSADQFANLVSQMRDSNPELAGFYESILQMANASEVATKQMGPLQTAFNNFKTSLDTLTGGFRAFFVQVMDSFAMRAVFAGLEKAVNLVGAAFEVVGKWLMGGDGVVAGFSQLVGAVLPLIGIYAAYKAVKIATTTAVTAYATAVKFATLMQKKNAGALLGSTMNLELFKGRLKAFPGAIFKSLAGLAGFVGKALVTFLWIPLKAAVLAIGGTIASVLSVPLLPLIAIIGAVTAAGYLLWKNWDTVSSFFMESWGKLTAWFSRLKEWFFGLFGSSDEDQGTNDGARIRKLTREGKTNELGGITGPYSPQVFGEGKTPEAAIPLTSGRKIPVAEVKIPPIDFGNLANRPTADVDTLPLQRLLEESNKLTKELIEVGKQQIGVTSKQTRELGNKLQTGLSDLDAGFAT